MTPANITNLTKNRSGYRKELKHFGCQLSQMRDWRSEIYVKKAQSIVIGKHATHIIIQRYQSINRAINQSFFNVKLMIIQWISKQFGQRTVPPNFVQLGLI